MRRLIRTLAILMMIPAALPAAAEIVEVPARASVADVMDSLVVEVEQAGATIFARVDHGAGAEQIGQPVGQIQLLIFGNPKIGTPALADDPLTGLRLPLKILVYENADGEVFVAYEDPREMFDDMAVSGDAAYLDTMSGALQRFANKAAMALN